MNRANDPRLEEAKGIPISEIVNRLGISNLRTSGAEAAGPCPGCGGTDRFSVNTQKGVFQCRKCDAKGDGIALTEFVRGCDFKAALDYLVGNVQPDPTLAAARRAEAQKRSAAAEKEARKFRDDAIAAAGRIWKAGHPIQGTPTESYLARRGLQRILQPAPPLALRHHPSLPYMHKGRELHRGPAMLAEITGPDGAFLGVHRTWLDLDQPNGKLALTHDGAALPAKKVLGSKKGGAIRLIGDGREILVMGEGIETTLSARVAFPSAPVSFWCAIDLGNMGGRLQSGKGLKYAGLPDLEDREAFVAPPETFRLTYLLDGDSDPRLTRAKLEAGLRRHLATRPNGEAGLVSAPEGRDLNDVLQDPSPEGGVDGVRALFRQTEHIAPAADADQAPGGPPPDDPDPNTAAPPEATAAPLPLNDIGNGARLTHYYGSEIMWVPRVGYFTWCGTHWAKDDDQIETRRKAQTISDRIGAEVWHLALPPEDMARIEAIERLEAELTAEMSKETPDETIVASIREPLAAARAAKKRLSALRTAHRRHAKMSGNTAKIESMIKEAGPALACPREDLDADPLWINTLSGLLRVQRFPGEDGASATADVALVPHDRAQRQTKMVRTLYDPAAGAPIFEAFLARVQPDPDVRAFLQRWFGLSLTGLTGEQKLVFLYGAGANGKSVLMETLARIFGSYAATAKTESLIGQNRRGSADATPDLIPLMGARLVRASEPDQGERLKEGMIKELTGGEPILVRALHSDFYEVIPQFKLTLSGNHKPEVRGTDTGIWRRLLVVPFDIQIPKAERDPNLVAKLQNEAPGILNWLLEGLVDYLEAGLQEPPVVLEATETYRKESDPVGEFLAECCAMREDAFTETRALVDAFNAWQHFRGEPPWRGRQASLRFKALSGTYRDSVGNTFSPIKRSVQGYLGIEISEEAQTAELRYRTSRGRGAQDGGDA